MKVLLSAYACQPNRGSEQGVGWRWALEIAKLGHEVWVITLPKYRSSIEDELGEMEPIPNLHFLYYDLPWFIKHVGKLPKGIYPHYYGWQWGAFRLARSLHRKINFERVHHITHAGVRFPSFMGFLGVPFIFGPVGGGEKVPWKLRKGYSLRGWIWEAMRDLSTLLIRFDPFMHATFSKAQVIYVCTPQSERVIPEIYRKKVKCQLTIGSQIQDDFGKDEKMITDENLRILFVGHFVSLKGMQLGIKAFAILISEVPNARLTLVGKGPDERLWKLLTRKLGIESNIDWISWVDQRELPEIYRKHHVFLFPSLRDSGGQVVLEAISYGLPVVCLNLGGPGEIINSNCGFKVNTDNLDENRVVKALADGLIQLAKDSRLYSQLSRGAFERTKDFDWSAQVARVYSPALGHKSFNFHLAGNKS